VASATTSMAMCTRAFSQGLASDPALV
jgi:hypothetical protein